MPKSKKTVGAKIPAVKAGNVPMWSGAKQTTAPDKSNTQQAYRGLGYSITRPVHQPVARSEAFEQRGHRRPLAWNTVHDLVENVPIVGWMCQTYLDFTTAFDFQPASSDTEKNLEIKNWFKKASGKKFVDIQRKLSAPQMLRNFGFLKLIGGDSLIAKLPAGKCQLFEAFQIAKGVTDPKLTGKAATQARAEIAQLNDLGLVLDDWGAVVAYGIATGDSTGALTHRMLVPYTEAIYDGWFTRPSCARPFSPLMPALNLAQDMALNVEYKLTQIKIHALIALLVKRDPRTAVPQHFGSGVPEGGAAGPPFEREPIDFTFSPGEVLELSREDEAKFLESQQPCAGWLEFTKELGRMILSVIHLPYALYDSTGSNYSRIQADMNALRIATRPEREKNEASYREMIDHMLDAAFAAGEVVFPKGITKASDFPYNLIDQSSYVVDFTKDTEAILKQVAAGLRSGESAAGYLGLGELYETIVALGNEKKEYIANGVTPVVGLPGQPVIEADADEPEEPTNKSDDEDSGDQPQK